MIFITLVLSRALHPQTAVGRVDVAMVRSADVQYKSGKVRGANLPQEYQLAKLMAGIENPHTSWSTLTPACEWQSVTCDDGKRIIKIDSGISRYNGSIHWQWLPETLQVFSMWMISGTIQLDLLPPLLTDLYLAWNRLSGGLELGHLPRVSRVIELHANKFEGSVDLAHLPPSLEVLNIRNNQLSGDVDLLKLPLKLRLLSISDNNFAGPLDLQHLPASLEKLLCRNNCFSGLVLFDKLPTSLTTLTGDGNLGLYGEVDQSLPLTMDEFNFQRTGVRIKSLNTLSNS